MYAEFPGTLHNVKQCKIVWLMYLSPPRQKLIADHFQITKNPGTIHFVHIFHFLPLRGQCVCTSTCIKIMYYEIGLVKKRFTSWHLEQTV